MKDSRPADRVIYRIVPWFLPIFSIVSWQGLSSAGILPNKILPAPADVFRAAWQLIQTGELVHHIAISLQRALTGLVIGGSIGFVLGLVNGMSRLAERFFDTSVQMIRNIPHLAMIPLVILWFGIGEQAKIFLVALGVLFPIYVNTLHGLRSVDSGLIEMGRVYGLRSWSLFRQVILPGALPSILVGIRFALGIMWLTLIVAETIASDAGIGYMAMNAREFMQTDVVVLSIVLYAFFGKLADVVARWLERICLKWNPNYQHV